MTKTEFIKLATNIIGVIALILVAVGVLQPDIAVGNDATARGVTNFDSITLSDDLVVGNTLTVSGATSLAAQTITGLTVNGNATITGTLDQQGNVSDSGGAFTVADNILLDGAADANQLTVQGNATQTNSLLVLEQSDGTDVTTVSNAGLMTLAGGLTTSDGNVVIADIARVTAQGGIVATDGNPITATGTYQPISAAGTVTPTIAAGTAGDILVLINTAAQTINIIDTGNQVLTANFAMGQYDSLMVWSDGTRWIEISRADN